MAVGGGEGENISGKKRRNEETLALVWRRTNDDRTVGSLKRIFGPVFLPIVEDKKIYIYIKNMCERGKGNSIFRSHIFSSFYQLRRGNVMEKIFHLLRPVV